jgi:hypothetical protein
MVIGRFCYIWLDIANKLYLGKYVLTGSRVRFDNKKKMKNFQNIVTIKKNEIRWCFGWKRKYYLSLMCKMTS